MEVLEQTRSTLKEVESRHSVILQLWKKRKKGICERNLYNLKKEFLQLVCMRQIIQE